MNLQHITTDLDRTLRRQLRRTDTLQTWADEHPALVPCIDTLLDRMRQRYAVSGDNAGSADTEPEVTVTKRSRKKAA